MWWIASERRYERAPHGATKTSQVVLVSADTSVTETSFGVDTPTSILGETGKIALSVPPGLPRLVLSSFYVPSRSLVLRL